MTTISHTAIFDGKIKGLSRTAERKIKILRLEIDPELFLCRFSCLIPDDISEPHHEKTNNLHMRKQRR